jgi:thiol-disulfide isomerase/thioredoxin
MARSRILCFAIISLLAGARVVAAETVLLAFTSDGCGPCLEMAPALRQLADQGCHVREVNISRDPASRAKYNVGSTPTFVVLVDGQPWARLEGRTHYAQLVEMMRKSTELAAARQALPPRVSPVDMETFGAEHGPPSTFAAGPTPGRVVSIQDPLAAAPTAPSRPPSGQPPASRGPAATVAAAAPENAAELIAATVRLSIEDPDGRSTGTGVIIDARSGEALVLTCGHLFRTSNGKGRIEISRFAATAADVQVVETTTGVLMHYDLNRDLAIVRFSPSSAPGVAPVAPLGTQLEPGAAVTSVGCNHGDNPTAWATRLTAINRYEGFPNIEAGGAPVEGRSGGGLFNAQGNLIGICFAADPKDDEGLYASLSSIHSKLDELQLSMVYQAPSRGQTPTAVGSLADNMPEPFAVRGQDPSSNAAPSAVPKWPGPSAPQTSVPTTAPQTATAPSASLTSQEQAALEEIARRGANSEVICIIRPQAPGGRSDVIKLSNVSPAFVHALTSQANPPAAARSPFDLGPTATAAAAGPAVR